MFKVVDTAILKITPHYEKSKFKQLVNYILGIEDIPKYSYKVEIRIDGDDCLMVNDTIIFCLQKWIVLKTNNDTCIIKTIAPVPVLIDFSETSAFLYSRSFSEQN